MTEPRYAQARPTPVTPPPTMPKGDGGQPAAARPYRPSANRRLDKASPDPTPIRGDDYPDGMCGYCGWGVFHDQPGSPPGSECPGRQT